MLVHNGNDAPHLSRPSEIPRRHKNYKRVRSRSSEISSEDLFRQFRSTTSIVDDGSMEIGRLESNLRSVGSDPLESKSRLSAKFQKDRSDEDRQLAR